MTEVVSFVTNNLIWILFGVIVILLAVIGGFADKTNFGEGKRIIKVKKKHNKADDLIDQLEVDKTNTEEVDLTNADEIIEGNNVQEQKTKDILLEEDNFLQKDNKEETSLEDNKKASENLTSDEFFKTDDLDVLLPKKDVVTGEFLQDVENINFDFGKSDVLSDIPDLDDLDLPNIKKKSPSKDNIWDL